MKKRLVSKRRFAFCTFFYGIYIFSLPLLLYVCVYGIFREKIYFGGILLILILLTGGAVLLRDYLLTVTVFYRFDREGIVLSVPGRKKIFRWDELNYCGAITAAWDSRDARYVYIYFSENYISENTLSSLSFDKLRKRNDIFWFLYNEEAFTELLSFIPPQWQEKLRRDLDREKGNLGPVSGLGFKIYK